MRVGVNLRAAALYDASDAINQLALYDFNFATGAIKGAQWSDAVVSRASTAYALNSAGAYESFASNVLRRTNLGVTIEEARTNGIRNNSMAGAVAGAPGTLPTHWTAPASPTNGISREIVGVGVENGINYIDVRITGTNTLGANYFYAINFDVSSSNPASSGQVWTGSMFAKCIAGSSAGLTGVSANMQVYDTPAFGVATTTFEMNVSAAPLSSSRLTATRTCGVTTTGIYATFSFTVSVGGTVDFTVRIGWPQLELGSFATTPIITSGSALTRPADVVYWPVTLGTGYSLYADADTPPLGYTAGAAVEAWASANDRFRINNFGTGFSLTYVSGGVATVGASGVSYGSNRKVASRASGTDNRLATSGTLGAVAANAAPSVAPTRAYIGSGAGGASQYHNAVIRRIAILPALTDAQLQAFTS